MKKYRISYKPFFRTLEEKGLSQNRFMSENEVSTSTVDRLRHDRNMTILTLAWLMSLLDVQDIGKILKIEFEKD